MTVQDLNKSFQYGMHGCGSYKGTNHVNSLEALLYWKNKGVKVFEIDIAKTIDNSYVALAHTMDAHCLKSVEINPYLDNSGDKFSEKWFLRNKLCEKTTGGLTPMNLETIINVMSHNPDIIVMFDLWGLWDSDSTYSFSKQFVAKSSDAIIKRSVLEVYNKSMVAGIRTVAPKLNVMYCVHGSSAAEFDENVNPEALKSLGISIISYPWACTNQHPGELEEYHKEGFTIFSLSRDNHFKQKMIRAGVNVNLVDLFYTHKSVFWDLLNKIKNKINKKIKGHKRPIMKEMTIEEVHTVALEMMKEIHAFCVENDIQYSLAYGSLLGAIRHKGFIPWDDDIDIWMTRPNFEKFTRTFKSKKGYRHLSIYDKDSLLCFDRVYEIEHTYVKNMTKACDDETGVWIDIMLLDSVPDDALLRNKQYSEWCEQNKLINIYKGMYTLKELHRYGSIFKNYLYYLIKGKSSFLKKETAYRVHAEQLKIMEKYTYTPSSNYCFFQCGVFYRNEPQELLPAHCFDSYQLAKFEDTELYIVKEYDILLKILFGDYMTPPPVDKRQKSHGICFWK